MPGPTTGLRLLAAPTAVSAGVAMLVWSTRRLTDATGPHWERTNHAGGTVSLVEGPAWALGALAGVAATAGLAPSVRLGVVVATAGSAAVGLVDDLVGTSHDKGLRGHLGALRRGRLTTGGLKVLGIGIATLAGSWPLLAAERARRRAAGGTAAGSLLDVVVSGALVAGSANLGNLLDLRPGRVLKVVLAASPLLLRGAPSQGDLLWAAGSGAALAMLPPDLGERAMLGDCGANAAGALLGSAVVTATGTRARGRTTRGALLALVVALTLASERVSFTRVIEATPVLRELDAAGRRRRPTP